PRVTASSPPFPLALLSSPFLRDPPPPPPYPLSLHDALPISPGRSGRSRSRAATTPATGPRGRSTPDISSPTPTSCRSTRHPCSRDRKSTRLNSSHVSISYAVFCLKKKNRRHSTRLHWRTDAR